MSDFGETWRLIRGRFDDAVANLSNEQLNYRMQPDALTLGESALHVAGAEISFVSQLLNKEITEELAKVKACATDGVVNDKPFPYAASEIDQAKVDWALAEARKFVEPVIDNLDEKVRSTQIVSVLGPVIDGTGAFARLAYHPGYHQGQAHLIKTSPNYPA